jgi:hypothetical protein
VSGLRERLALWLAPGLAPERFQASRPGEGWWTAAQEGRRLLLRRDELLESLLGQRASDGSLVLDDLDARERIETALRDDGCHRQDSLGMLLRLQHGR